MISRQRGDPIKPGEASEAEERIGGEIFEEDWFF
jgi:hypothetical protein